MTTSEFKKVARLLKEAYKELEADAFDVGVDIFSDEYQRAQDVVRQAVLDKLGFTLEEYREAKELISRPKKEEIKDELQKIVNKDISPLILTGKQVEEIASRVVKPPQIINKIIKETVVEKPQIIKETIIEKSVESTNYDDERLQERLNSVSKRLDELSNSAPDMVKLKTELENYLSANLEYNIDILGMPNFRKLAMGLQGQIDELRASSSTSGGTGVETPTGSVDGSNVTFTVANTPKFVVTEQGIIVENVGYTLSGLTITMNIAPVQFIRSIY
jgi:hypothetical protein